MFIVITAVKVDVREVTELLSSIVGDPLVEYFEDLKYDIVIDLTLGAVVVVMVEVVDILLLVHVVDTVSFVKVELGNDEAVSPEFFVDSMFWTDVVVAGVSIVSHKTPFLKTTKSMFNVEK